jgi:hypothetical protein
LSGVTTISPAESFALFMGSVLAITGICLLTLGISFNYFVALFHKQPVRQGLFSRSTAHQWPERYFGWLGIIALAAGVAIGSASLFLGYTGWEVSRLWLYYLASASLALIGIQLVVAWIQMQVLYALSEREAQIDQDMNGGGVESPFNAEQPHIIVRRQEFSNGEIVKPTP